MLPMVELTIFALGILLIDLMIPRAWKWLNAAGAFLGVVLATFCVWRIQETMPRGSIGFFNALLVDRFAMYFWYLFLDRKSTRLNSSHLGISYAVFCLKKKKTI